jgi:hypothetical protein
MRVGQGADAHHAPATPGVFFFGHGSPLAPLGCGISVQPEVAPFHCKRRASGILFAFLSSFTDACRSEIAVYFIRQE